MRPFQIAAFATLVTIEAFSTSHAATPQQIQLTLDSAANVRFAADVKAALVALQTRLGGRLCHPLVSDKPLTSRPDFCAAPAPAAVAHVVVLREGVFWRVASTHPAQLEGPAPIGSVAKAVVALPLLAHAGAAADERWCVKSVAGLRNADGTTGREQCEVAANRILATTAMARSNNLATIWRLRQLDLSYLRRELAEAGIDGIPEDLHPAVASVLGVLDVSPRQVVECFDALASGHARRAAITRHAQSPATPMARWCATAVSTGTRRHFVDQMLQSPVRSGGTAAFLPAMLPGASGWVGKTGTPSDDAARDTGKLLVFGLHWQKVRYTVLISVASPRAAWPLAQRLSATDLAGIAKLGIAAIAGDSGP